MMMGISLRGLPKNEAIDCLLGHFYRSEVLDREFLQIDSVIVFKDFESFSGLQVRVNCARIVHDSEHSVGCVEKIERIGGAIAEIEIPREKCEGRARIVEEVSFSKPHESGFELAELRLDGYGYRSCTKVLGASGKSKCVCSGCLLSFNMSLALCGQFGLGLSLFPRGSAANVFLSSQRNRESGKRETCLRPSGPLTLRNAIGRINPTAIVDRIGHVITPVKMQGIVDWGCG